MSAVKTLLNCSVENISGFWQEEGMIRKFQGTISEKLQTTFQLKKLTGPLPIPPIFLATEKADFMWT